MNISTVVEQLDAYAGREGSRKTLILQLATGNRMSLVADEKNVEDTRKLMSEAGGSYLEVIQAQSSLLNVQLSKVADDFYKMQAVVNLYSALGGGAK